MSAVSLAMRARILTELDRICAEENVVILIAAESGSRAWGFHSPDSDYDVRFVYVRPVDWHLRLDPRRDVIERPLSDELDISGWDLGKALRLAMNSNAVLPEWLQSPITYAEAPGARADLTGFCATVLNRRAVGWHYLNLARRQQARLRDDSGQVRLKRYLYTLRPALALRWMRLHARGLVPMDMARLMAETDLPAPVRGYLDALIARKLTAGELGHAATTDPQADALIASEMALALDGLAMRPPGPRPDHWALANALHHRWVTSTGGGGLTP